MNAAAHDRLSLKVGGELYEGWKAVSIRLGIDRIAGSFELGLTERWPHQPRDWPIPPGEHCAVTIGGEPVVSGYVDKMRVSFDGGSHNISVTGRDRTGDLVDCSAPASSFSGISFLEIARRLAKPYQIAVTDESGAGGKAIPKFSIQAGDSVFSTLEKLARQVGVLLVSDGQGGLKITRGGRGGQATDPLEAGRNILAAEIDHDHSELYSSITVKGQASAAGASAYDLSSAGAEGSVSAAPSASRRVSSIDRFRPLVIVAETQADAARCRKRAEWEAGKREATSRKISVTVQGWRQSDGLLWRINQTVRLIAPWLRADGRWLISALDFTLDEGGTKTVLTLVGVKAFDSLPEIPTGGGSASASGQGSGKFQVVGK
jgi:prophage tail gpP-like protein